MNMRRLHIVGRALLALLSIGAIAGASSALALTSGWLVDGSLTESTKVLSEGTVLLEDMGIPAAFECPGEGTGSVGPGTEAQITTVTFNLAGCKLDPGTNGCTAIDNVAAVNLPWLTELTLGKNAAGEEVFLDLILNGGKGTPGYLVECVTALGLINDVCTNELGSADIDNTTEGDVLALLPENVVATSEQGNCSIGGNEKALLVGTTLVYSPEGLTIAVSEA
jgi:hypothetical protein